MANEAKRKRDEYENFLLNAVMVHGWTTVRCAKELQLTPKAVLRDFNEICQRLNSESKNNPKRKR
jgi:hypothetical protein